MGPVTSNMAKLRDLLILLCAIAHCTSSPTPSRTRVDADLLPQAGAGYAEGIYMSINALAFTLDSGAIVRRRLELNWWRTPSPGDTIILKKANETVLALDPADHPDGFYVTDIVLPYPTLTAQQRSCVYDYEMVWADASNNVLANTCLLAEPRWMEDNQAVIGKLALGDMMLPGSHDSGAYKEYSGQGDDNWATSAVYAQEENLLNQMMWGVRFMDIRVGHYPYTEERFWLVHDIIKTHPMKEGIEDVKTFLRNTREVIVWENNNFVQVWGNEAHMEWAERLVEEFGEWMVRPGDKGWDMTLEEAMASPGPEGQGRIIITYNYRFPGGEEILKNYFPEVREEWGDKDEPEELKAYLDEKVEQARASPASFRPWKPNCQMTPTAEDIIGPRWSGLREMADAVNRDVTRWWREQWTEIPATFPVHDFVLSTGMVHESIRRNIELANK